MRAETLPKRRSTRNYRKKLTRLRQIEIAPPEEAEQQRARLVRRWKGELDRLARTTLNYADLVEFVDRIRGWPEAIRELREYLEKIDDEVHRVLVAEVLRSVDPPRAAPHQDVIAEVKKLNPALAEGLAQLRQDAVQRLMTSRPKKAELGTVPAGTSR